MASVLHRTTKKYLASVNTPDYLVATWIRNPDLSSVTGFPSKYWIITGDVVTLMDQAARDDADAAILDAGRDTKASCFDKVENEWRAFALMVLDEFTVHANKTNAILDAIDGASSLATVKSAIAAISDVPVRTISDMKTEFRNKLGT